MATKAVKVVYMLEDGDYSDYHVIGIYSTRDRAKTVSAKVGGTIREMPMNPGYDDICNGFTPWQVWMLRDGTTERVMGREPSGYDIGDECRVWRRSEAPAYRGKGIPDCLDATVWARDEQHAVKIVNEKRAQMIAEGKWA